MTMTKTWRREPYASILPIRPGLAQTGRVVLVGGGSTGVGFSIAQSFAAANAAKVIILGRRKPQIDEAVSNIGKEFPQVQVEGRQCDVGDAQQTEALWDALAAEKTVVDVLVLSSVLNGLPETILDMGTEKVWQQYTVNVRAAIHFTERFYKQPGRDATRKLVSEQPFSNVTSN